MIRLRISWPDNDKGWLHSAFKLYDSGDDNMGV